MTALPAPGDVVTLEHRRPGGTTTQKARVQAVDADTGAITWTTAEPTRKPGHTTGGTFLTRHATAPYGTRLTAARHLQAVR